MKLSINGIPVEAGLRDSFQQLVAAAGLETNETATRPLAVQAGGMIIPLSFIPASAPAPGGQDRPYRRALESAGGCVTTVTMEGKTGPVIYKRSLIFVLLAAFHRLFPDALLHSDYAVLSAEFFSAYPESILTEENVRRLKEECKKIIREDTPLTRERLYTDDVIEELRKTGYENCARLLSWRVVPYFDLYRLGEYADYLYSEFVPSTGYLTIFDLALDGDKLVLLFPRPDKPEQTMSLPKSEKLSATFSKAADWNRIMHCETISDLNDLVSNGSVRELVRVNEALHEKDYASIADRTIASGARALLLAGPSSSGKTTSANRICTQLRVLGKSPVLISMDDYYKDRDKCTIFGPDGKLDLEHVECLNIDRFREDISALIAGKEVRLPRFDFKTQRSIPDGGKLVKNDKDTVVVIEGIHGLNPLMLPDTVDRGAVFKVYVSAMTTLNLDSHNRIPTTQLRLLRRMVRDYKTRNSSISDTLSMWDSVRRGEDRWIFPFQEEADAMFNSSLVYEPAVMKKYVYPLLMNVRPDNPYYEEARGIVKFLNYILEADLEDEIPPTSVLREFIGGNTFYR